MTTKMKDRIIIDDPWKQRKLTTGEREAIAGALYKLANERQEEADRILAGAGFFQHEGSEPDEESSAKLERLAGTIVGRYKSLVKSARAHGNLADFLTNPRHSVTVQCLVLIPEQF